MPHCLHISIHFKAPEIICLSGVYIVDKNAAKSLHENTKKKHGSMIVVSTHIATALSSCSASRETGRARETNWIATPLIPHFAPFHKPFSILVSQNTTLPTAALRHEASSTVNSSRMELHEFEVLQGQAGTGGHGTAVSGTRVRAGGREVCPSIPCWTRTPSNPSLFNVYSGLPAHSFCNSFENHGTSM